MKRYLTQCQCRVYAGKKICSRTLEITQYTPRGRRCHKSVKRVEHLCDCTDKYSAKVCRKAVKDNLCHKRNFKVNCAYHCNPRCKHCKVEEVFKSCVQNGRNKGKLQVLRIKYLQFHKLSIFVKHLSFEGHCKTCDKNQVRTVSSCSGGKRVVVTRYVDKLLDGSCINKEKREFFSCSGCCKDIVTKIGACHRLTRAVTRVFWANVKGYCRKQVVSNVYECNSRCAAVQVTKTKCIYNKRLVVKRWFSDSICIPHTAHEVADCCP